MPTEEFNMYSMQNVYERFKGYLMEVANIHAKFREMFVDMDECSKHLGDNGDPALDMEKVLLDMGSLLADMTVYVNEYEEELKKNV